MAAPNYFSNAHKREAALVEGDGLLDLVGREGLVPEWNSKPFEDQGHGPAIDSESVAQVVDGETGSVPIGEVGDLVRSEASVYLLPGAGFCPSWPLGPGFEEISDEFSLVSVV